MNEALKTFAAVGPLRLKLMYMQTKTISVNLPPEMLEQAERLAKKEGRSRNDLLQEALRRYLIQIQYRELQRYGMKRARELGLKESDVEQIIHEYREEQRRQMKSEG